MEIKGHTVLTKYCEPRSIGQEGYGMDAQGKQQDDWGKIVGEDIPRKIYRTSNFTHSVATVA